MVSSLDELSKAYDAYILDTGTDLDVVKLNVYVKIEDLIVKNSVSGWKGSYISNELGSASHVLSFSGGASYIFAIHAIKEKWPVFTTSTDKACVTGKACMVYVGINGQTKEIADLIEKYIDGSIDYQDGTVRVFPISGDYHIFIKKRPTLNQP